MDRGASSCMALKTNKITLNSILYLTVGQKSDTWGKDHQLTVTLWGNILNTHPHPRLTSLSSLSLSSRLFLSCSSMSSCLTAYLVMTSSRLPRAVSLLSRSLRSSVTSDRAGSEALEGEGRRGWVQWQQVRGRVKIGNEREGVGWIEGGRGKDIGMEGDEG